MIGEKATAARASRAAGTSSRERLRRQMSQRVPTPNRQGKPRSTHSLWPQSCTMAQTVRRIEGRGGLARGQGLPGRGLHGRQGQPGLIGPEVPGPQVMEAEINRHPKDQRHGQNGKVWPG